MSFSIAHKAAIGVTTLTFVCFLFWNAQAPSNKSEVPRAPSSEGPLPSEFTPHSLIVQTPTANSATAPTAPPVRGGEAPLDDKAEQELMKELRDLRFTQPELTLELARDGNERFQETENAAERRWFEARALVELQRFEEAQDVGRTMLDSHPESSFTADVRRHLFSNPFGEAPRHR